eukprot:CAMPEP_0117488516 /NCGR_PEP_ID=MMETSP0784-20121206/16556_1 /TAXON_ID=39447 /ORGANISM="" /LENGTH=155 /DNA_ID=CAMNT_0005283207 /DNA_START=93 /DNA_END=560 /DNA_ORIENTATION=+
MRADVDTVEELSDVLVLDQARLADQSGGTRGCVNVSATHDELVLGARALFHLDPRKHVHCAHELLAQKVAEFDGAAPIRDVRVDGEVRVNETQLILELFLDAVEQVLDVAANAAQHRKLLGFREIHARPYLVAAGSGPELDGQMFEVALQGAMLA